MEFLGGKIPTKLQQYNDTSIQTGKIKYTS